MKNKNHIISTIGLLTAFMAKADCWSLGAAGPSQLFGMALPARVDRVCAVPKAQQRVLLKLYSGSETVANLDIETIGNEKSRWNVTGLRLPRGSWVLTAPFPSLKLPFFKNDTLDIEYNGRIESYATISIPE